MLYFLVKVIVSALLVAAISEIARRSSGFAALVASLPLTSVLAFVWLHVDGAGPVEIANLSRQIFWLVLPSLLPFLLLPVLLKAGINFWGSLAISVAGTAILYLAMLPMLRRLGIAL